MRSLSILLLALALLPACAKESDPQDGSPAAREAADAKAERPDLLLVTLDTTRADHLTPGTTPHLNALAARGVRFTAAYATAPTTFPSHASMMSGLYPAGHGVHENGRHLNESVPLLAERLRDLGYSTAAFVSGYPLERQFGLARGFDLYDDELGTDENERRADATTDRALAWLDSPVAGPRFLWVHYYDAHEPYAPPEPFRSRFAGDLYRGEIAFVDSELGRLVEAFERGSNKGGVRLLIVADHGEGRGDHGEMLHGNLLYQGVMNVPLILAGDGIEPAARHDAVSIRQVRATLLEWAGGPPASGGLSRPIAEPALGEAMQPFLNYRWQPQTMATDGKYKLIRSGRLEIYDLESDPEERQNLSSSAGTTPDRALTRAVADYPLPLSGSAPATPADEESRQKLASLGYVSFEGAPAAVPSDAPRAADMTSLFGELDTASRLFANADYRRAAPLFERILSEDSGNLMAAVRLAVSRSFLGDDRGALAAFATASRIDPSSVETRHYLAMHHLKMGRGEHAAPLFEQVLAVQPDRLAALEGLAAIRAREGRLPEAAALFERAVPLSRSPGALLAELGQLRMAMGETAPAIAAFERARETEGATFRNDLELGVLYLAAKRLSEARDALDRVPAAHPGYPMALFKRAQVSVLLGEADSAARIRAAREHADAVTQPLIANERLFASAP